MAPSWLPTPYIWHPCSDLQTWPSFWSQLHTCKLQWLHLEPLWGYRSASLSTDRQTYSQNTRQSTPNLLCGINIRQSQTTNLAASSDCWHSTMHYFSRQNLMFLMLCLCRVSTQRMSLSSVTLWACVASGYITYSCYLIGCTIEAAPMVKLSRSPHKKTVTQSVQSSFTTDHVQVA